MLYVKWFHIEKTDNTKCLKVCKATGTLLHCYQGCKLVQLLRKQAFLLNKFKPRPTFRTLKFYFGVSIQVHVHEKTYLRMSIEAFLIVAKCENSPGFH